MSPPAESAPVYSAEDRALLLRTAHRAIAAACAGSAALPLPEAGELSPALTARRAAFTTLHLDGLLRGCVGYVLAAKPLIETVAETAVSAALHDPRFPAVTAAEAPRLKIEISVLSPSQPIRPHEIVPGRHGLIVSMGTRRGLLLPQVAPEHGWDALTFLAQTCAKAGLPPDAWQQGATIEAFTAEVFAEE
ncbi:MAG: AmmeMemoRadiSam system protein A [Candidatus Koribacter versatilis]|uniref:AmmeMemoRadiSam system protein A n=1 Tax=Candidatus Korobacter versatilis TaxID=658062 RepID=A0A932ERH0_9BACT|nr:AmmeMemoRadiSam system protein A [Candidatus Koribacter versatilis]